MFVRRARLLIGFPSEPDLGQDDGRWAEQLLSRSDCPCQRERTNPTYASFWKRSGTLEG